MGIGTISTQLLLDIADCIYIVVDINQKVSLINKRGCKILGYSEDEILGKNWFDDFLSKEVAKNIKSDFVKRINKNEETDWYENYLVLTKEREERLISWHNTLINDEEGNVSGMICSGEDITEQTRTNNVLKESEEKYRGFVQNCNCIFYKGTMDFRPIFFHGIVEEITGYTEEEFVLGPLTWDKLIHPDDIGKINEEMEKLIHIPNYSTSREYRIINKNGEIKWINELIQNVSDENSEILFVQGSLYDITEQKIMRNKLEESEEKYRILFHEMDHAYALYEMIYDKKGVPEDAIIIEVNPKYENLLDKKRKEVIGKKVSEIYPRVKTQDINQDTRY